MRPSKLAPAAAGITLKTGALDKLMAKRKIDGVVHLAEILGLHRTTVWRVMEGQARPGTPFIAACISQLGVRFEDLFTIEDVAA